MNFVDGVIIVVLGFYIFDGWRRGFIEVFLELISFIISTILAWHFDKQLGDYIAQHITVPEIFNQPVGFLTIWFGAQFIFSLVIRLSQRFIPKIIKGSLINRISGILPSVAKGLILSAVFLILLTTLPITESIKKEVNGSFSGSRIVKRSAFVEGVFRRLFGDSLENMTAFITVKDPVGVNSSASAIPRIIDPNERLHLGFMTSDITVDGGSETQMLEYINRERAKNGIGPLVADPALQKVARAHAQDMFAKGYFSHINIDNESPFDRMAKAGVTYAVAGENLALAPNVDLAHAGLMNSPGHRANILEPRFGRVGIGVIDSGIYGKMFVQNFRN